MLQKHRLNLNKIIYIFWAYANAECEKPYTHFTIWRYTIG